MSELFEYQILKIEEDTITVKAQIVHPDQKTIYEDYNIALQIILEPYWLMQNEYVYSLKISKEEAKRFFDDHPLKTQMLQWLEWMYGEKRIIDKETYDKLQARELKFENSGGWGMSNGVYYVSFNPNYQAFIDIAVHVIKNVKVENLKNYPWSFDRLSYEEQKKLTEQQWDEIYQHEPEGDIVIQVADKKLFFHLREGFSWDSAMYNFNYYV